MQISTSCRLAPSLLSIRGRRKRELQESVMGKYFVGWLLGIPLAVLVLVWLFFR